MGSRRLLGLKRIRESTVTTGPAVTVIYLNSEATKKSSTINALVDFLIQSNLLIGDDTNSTGDILSVHSCANALHHRAMFGMSTEINMRSMME